MSLSSLSRIHLTRHVMIWLHHVLSQNVLDLKNLIPIVMMYLPFSIVQGQHSAVSLRYARAPAHCARAAAPTGPTSSAV